MIPPALHSVPVYPGINLGTAIRAILGDSAAERRTLEDLRKEHAETEQRICNSAGTSQQCRGWNKEKQRLSEAIKTKEIAAGFTNGSLVPIIEERQGRRICTFAPRSDYRRQIRKAAAKVFRRNAGRNPRQVIGQEDSKPIEWSRLLLACKKVPLEVLKS
jgi:hypothetical protein